MLGCYEEALEARQVHGKSGIGGWNATEQHLDNGWIFLGSGHSRWAYLSPSKVVYKVGTAAANKAEHEAAVLMRNIEHPLVGIPETNMFDELGVLAMQFIAGIFGVPSDRRGEFQRAVDSFGQTDQWFRNLIFDGEKIWLIDLGEFQHQQSLKELEDRVLNLSKKK